MTLIKSNTYFLKNALLILLALFSLASCSVKEPVFRAIGIDYVRPLNQNKSTQTFEDSCKVHEKSSLPVVEIQHIDHQKLFTVSGENMYFDFQQKIENVVSETARQISVNTHPLYILYKRLKFDLA